MRTLPIVGPGLVALAALLLPLSGFGHRFKLWGLRAALALAVVAGIAAASGTALCLLFLSQDAAGSVLATSLALGGSVVGLLALALPARRLALGLRAPAIDDLTTDPDDPPAFVALTPAAVARPPSAGPRSHASLLPLDLELPVEAAYAAAHAAANELGWDVVASNPNEGRLEATTTTFWFGFTGSVAIRVRPRNGGSRVDVRSLSHSGKTDLGANAARVREFLELVGGGG